MRLAIYFGIVLLVVFLMTQAFPEALSDGRDKFGLVYYLVLLLGLGSLWVMGLRLNLKQGIKYALLWAGVFAVLIIGASLWQDFAGPAGRLAGRMAPGNVEQENGAYWVARSQDGHFYVNAEVEGTSVRFMVDTGASLVTLSARDAERLGIVIENLDFSVITQTANGTVAVAPVTLSDVVIGGLALQDVSAVVSDGGLDVSLLGMSFLDRLNGFERRGDRLILYP